jgi:hypothetical protein
MIMNRDVAFLGASGAIIAATGASENDLNLVFWDTLAPSTTSRASVFCHEGNFRTFISSRFNYFSL